MWSGDGEKKKIHYKYWQLLCKPMRDGGMGFRDLNAFNLALIAKLGWRLLTKPDSLVVKLLKAKYYQNSSFWDANLGGTPSYCWRSIMAARQIILVGYKLQVSNGEKINI